MKKFLLLSIMSTLLFSCSTFIMQTKPNQVSSEAAEPTIHTPEQAKLPVKETPAEDLPKQTKQVQENTNAPKSNAQPNERGKQLARADSPADKRKPMKPAQQEDDAPKLNVEPDIQASQPAKEVSTNESALTPYPPDYDRNYRAEFERGFSELKVSVQSYEALSKSASPLTVEALSRWKKNYDDIISNIFGANVFFAANGSPENAKHYAIWPRYLNERIEALKQLKTINRECDGPFSDDVKKELQSHYEMFDKQLINCEKALPSALQREAEITGQRPAKTSSH